MHSIFVLSLSLSIILLTLDFPFYSHSNHRYFLSHYNYHLFKNFNKDFLRIYRNKYQKKEIIMIYIYIKLIII